jgi:hypothetical protein
MPAQRRGGQAGLRTALGHLVQPDQGRHLPLDLVQADQGVELVQELAQPGGPAGGRLLVHCGRLLWTVYIGLGDVGQLDGRGGPDQYGLGAAAGQLAAGGRSGGAGGPVDADGVTVDAGRSSLARPPSATRTPAALPPPISVPVRFTVPAPDTPGRRSR